MKNKKLWIIAVCVLLALLLAVFALNRKDAAGNGSGETAAPAEETVLPAEDPGQTSEEEAEKDVVIEIPEGMAVGEADD